MSDRALANFFRQLATLLDAGVPVARALATLAEQDPRRWRRLSLTLRASIEEGATLTEAMTAQRRAFTGLQLSLVQAGEHSGRLPDVLGKLADAIELMDGLKKQILSRLIYPVVLLHVGVCVPAVVAFFLQGTAAAVASLLWGLVPVYGGVALVWLAYRVGTAIPAWCAFLDTVACYLPVIGGVVRNLAVARFTRSFAGLYDAGIAAPRALELAAAAAGNALIRNRLLQARGLLRDGVDLGHALQATGAFSPMINSMILTGTETGQLAAMLYKICATAEDDARRSIQVLGVIIPLVIYLAIVMVIALQLISMYANLFAGINELLK